LPSVVEEWDWAMQQHALCQAGFQRGAATVLGREMTAAPATHHIRLTLPTERH